MKKLISSLFIVVVFSVVGCQKQKGCTEPNAINYDSAAEENDGSCVYNTTSDTTSNTTDTTNNTVNPSLLPVVTTLPIDSFGDCNASALFKGIVVSEGGSAIIQRGFCWDTLSTVDTSSNNSKNGAGIGSFANLAEGLNSFDKSYYVRAYAVNSYGIKYGDAVHFKTEAGKVTSLDCEGISWAPVSGGLGGLGFKVDYSGGNGCEYKGQTIYSTGDVTGFILTLEPGYFADGDGFLLYKWDTLSPKGSGTANFTFNIGGHNCVYSWEGIQYGNGVTDINGNTYQSVIIGNQEWMAENLRTTKYNDGSSIPNVTDGNQWSGLTKGAWSHYNNDNQYETTYGKLYNWYVVNTGNLCPTGWHVPTDAEWTVLTDYLAANGHSGSEGAALKSTTGWNNNGNGTDNYSFNGLPGGFRDFSIGSFDYIGYDGGWWSSSQSDANNAYYRRLSYKNDYVIGNGFRGKKDGFSVRCLRD